MTELRERRLSDVSVEGVVRVALEDGPGVRGVVRLRLCDATGGAEGPSVAIEMTAPLEEDDAERSLLREAHEILRRLARESEEELQVLLRLFRPSR